MDRVVWVATGIAWAFGSLLDLLSPRYFHAVTAVDYLSVWSLTAALLLSAPAVILLSHLSPLRSVRVIAIVAAAGAVLAGLSDAAEDALRLPVPGEVFLAGILGLTAALLACAGVLAISRSWRLAAVFALWSAGMLMSVAVPGGGLLILVALVAVAVKPGWFRATAGRPPGEHASPRR